MTPEDVIALAIAAEPGLTQGGFKDGRPLVATDQHLLGQIETVLEWFERVGRGGSAKPGGYGLKHEIENWAQRYVSEGALISCAIALGRQWGRLSHAPQETWVKVPSEPKRERLCPSAYGNRRAGHRPGSRPRR